MFSPLIVDSFYQSVKKKPTTKSKTKSTHFVHREGDLQGEADGDVQLAG